MMTHQFGHKWSTHTAHTHTVWSNGRPACEWVHFMFLSYFFQFLLCIYIMTIPDSCIPILQPQIRRNSKRNAQSMHPNAVRWFDQPTFGPSAKSKGTSSRGRNTQSSWIFRPCLVFCVNVQYYNIGFKSSWLLANVDWVIVEWQQTGEWEQTTFLLFLVHRSRLEGSNKRRRTPFPPSHIFACFIIYEGHMAIMSRTSFSAHIHRYMW